MLVAISRAASILGVCAKTLRRWEAKGLLRPYRTQGNHRRYEVQALHAFLESGTYLPSPKSKTGVAAIYARVSSATHRTDLDRQKAYLQEKAQQDGYAPKIYSDIGSGLNDARPSLLKLLIDGLKQKYDIIYLTYLDRLARFGTKTLLTIFQQMNIEIRVVHVPPTQSFEKTLVDDMIALVTSFAGKVHRSRRGKNTPVQKSEQTKKNKHQQSKKGKG